MKLTIDMTRTSNHTNLQTLALDFLKEQPPQVDIGGLENNLGTTLKHGDVDVAIAHNRRPTMSDILDNAKHSIQLASRNSLDTSWQAKHATRAQRSKSHATRDKS